MIVGGTRYLQFVMIGTYRFVVVESRETAEKATP
jgi:hypothetical protein